MIENLSLLIEDFRNKQKIPKPKLWDLIKSNFFNSQNLRSKIVNLQSEIITNSRFFPGVRYFPGE